MAMQYVSNSTPARTEHVTTSSDITKLEVAGQSLPEMFYGIGLASLEVYMRDPTGVEALEECKKVASSFITTGALLISDPRATPSSSSSYLDLLESYFSQSSAILSHDLRPLVGYQVGVTLEHTEKPSCGTDAADKCQAIIEALDVDERPLDLGREGRADPKCRFFWKMSEGREVEGRAGLAVTGGASNGEADLHSLKNVVPRGFEDVWEDKMEDWGSKMKAAVEGVAEMLSVGLGLPRDFLTDAGKHGSHLLAPTATDLVKYGKENEIFAGFHSDMNCLTIHGKSRYPGLHIWARNSGKRIQVKVPDGCLLLQAGKQLEWLTGGLIRAGYHEVVCTKETVAAIERMKGQHPERPLIRISSTFFWHLSPDFVLEALPVLKKIAEEKYGEQEEYGTMTVTGQVRRELGLIALMA